MDIEFVQVISINFVFCIIFRISKQHGTKMDVIQIHEPYNCGKCHHIGIISYRLLIYIIYSHLLYRMPSITTAGISLRVHQNDYDTKSGEMMEG